MHIKTKQLQRGVSLVELAVSISLVGLLIAGTLGGMNLVKASKIRKIATELTTYKLAVKEFEEQYGYLPGDIAIASTIWPGTNNGDGDGFVKSTSATLREDLYAWEHLALSGIIPGSYNGTSNPGSIATDGYVIGENTPGSDGAKGGAYIFVDEGANIYNDALGVAFRLGGIDAASNNSPYNGIVSAKTASSIDKKIDDGLASRGLFMTIRLPAGTDACVDSNYTSAESGDYKLDDSTKNCHLIYWYKKY